MGSLDASGHRRQRKDAAHCKRISIQDKPIDGKACAAPRRRARFSNREKRLGRRKFCLSRPPCLDKQILSGYGIVPPPSAI